MLSKPKIKLIRSLAQKKYRRETGLFVAEGRKVVEELLAVFEPELIVALPAWLDAHATGGERVAVSPDEPAAHLAASGSARGVGGVSPVVQGLSS